ncbi:MAG: hypothetical protein ACXVED_16500, partial [Bacteroidia bacterium]
MKLHITKNLIASSILVLGISFSAFSVNYTSAGAGPVAWNVATSWIPNGIPTGTDNVTIAAGHTITLNTAGVCNNLTINGTLKGLSMSLTVKGNYINNGLETGSGVMSFINSGAFTISGAGTFSSAVSFSFAANSTRTISAGTTMVKTGGTGISTNAVVTNLGTVTLGVVNTNTGSKWINSTNSSLTLKN